MESLPSREAFLQSLTASLTCGGRARTSLINQNKVSGVENA